MEGSRGLKALENWAKRVTSGYNEVKITDMSSSWRNGLAFCAIIHHYRPDLIDFESLSKEDILYNNSLAFSTAEKQLGVPALLDAEDMVNCKHLDRLSIFTYLSQLHNCFENQNRVNKARSPVKRVLKEGQSGPPSKAPLTEQKNSVLMVTKDVCQICKHRVFILERLMVAGKLYHRTCFKCSKCNSILKPGAYVESDTAGSYECAICPVDEEKENSHVNGNKNFNVHSENENSVELQEDILTHRSSLTSPKLSLLSTPLNSARNLFLQESVSSDSACELEEPSLDEPKTNGHFSTISDSVQNSSDEAHDSKSEAASKIKSSVDAKLSPADDVSPKSLRKPYQSLFSREISQTTSLKSLNITSLRNVERQQSADTIVSGAKSSTVGFRARDFNIPFIKSSTYTSPLSLSRPSSATNLHFKQLSSPSAKLEREFSSGSLSDKIQSYRRSSLDAVKKHSESSSSQDNERTNNGTTSEIQRTIFFRNKEGTVEVKESDVIMKEDTQDLNVYDEQDTNATKSSKSDVSGKKIDVDQCPKNIVKQLIEQKEADIALNNVSSSVKIIDYRRRSEPGLPNSESMPSNISEQSSFRKSLINHFNEVGTGSECSSIDTNNISKKNSLSQIVSDDISVDTIPSVKEIENQINENKISESEPFVEKSEKSEEEKLEADTPKAKVDVKIKDVEKKDDDIVYPDELNPFGDEEDTVSTTVTYPDDLNPFGDPDEESVNVSSKNDIDDYDDSKNPFATDDDDDNKDECKVTTKSVHKLSVPTLNAAKIMPTELKYSPQNKNLSVSPSGSLKGTLKKRKAPKPPLSEVFQNGTLDSSSDTSSICASPSPSPNKFSLKTPSPKLLKNKPAPRPPVSRENVNGSVPDLAASNKLTKEMDNMKLKSSTSLASSPLKVNENSSNQWKKKKRPAPPVPIPPRREIKKIPLKDIQAEMKEIEEKQIELEKQGRELEVLIRERDKDEEPTVEEEECIMQLFELVNQKNALFRRQAELMYIKRSQRLEEEQVELEFQIRCLMLKPASQRTEEDKKKEEHLVQRLLDVVDQRNEIVDSIEMDRRREIEEDVSVQEQMEIKNSDLPITAEIKEKSTKQKKKKHKEKKEKKEKKKKKAQEESNHDVEEGSRKDSKKKWF